MWQVKRRLVGVLSVAVASMMVLALSSCSSVDKGPRDALERFLSAWSEQDLDLAGSLTDDPARASDGLAQAWEGLVPEELSYSTGKARVSHDSADIDVTYTWKFSGDREWSYPSRVKLGSTDGGWAVRWSSTTIHPDLGGNQRLVRKTVPAPRAAVNESDGSQVMTTGTLIGVNFDAEAAAEQGSVADSASRLVTALASVDDSLSAQGIAEQATAADGVLPITRLSEEDFNRLRDQLAIPGVVTNEQPDLVATDPRFAPALLSEVKKVVASELDGQAGWRVVSVNPNGLDADVLVDHEAQPAPAVSLTLSRSVQNAAQRAVDATGRFAAAMVVVQPSTGNILAVAQNRLADRQGPIATTGLYPPGSTFKIVTAAAAISNDIAHPSTMVPCPGEIEIGPRRIPNYNGFALGTVSLRTAFASSCNTTFAKLAADMGPSDLAHAAAAMGLGQHYSIAGLDAVSGSVPIDAELVARSEDGFGQGRVLASPLGMSLVAATVANGAKAPVPQLILGKETAVEGPTPTLDPSVFAQLVPMMRAVVTEGTGTVIGGLGAVHGKTGEAEFAGGSHAWFAGYRGDLAFATLVVGGGDSNNAVGMTRDFFASLPPWR